MLCVIHIDNVCVRARTCAYVCVCVSSVFKIAAMLPLIFCENRKQESMMNGPINKFNKQYQNYNHKRECRIGEFQKERGRNLFRF